MNSNQNNNQNNTPRRPRESIWTILMISLVLVLVFTWIYNAVASSQYTKTTYSDFLYAKEHNQLAEVLIKADRIVYLTKEEAAKSPSQQRACFTGLPSGGDTMALAQELYEMGVINDTQIVEDNSVIMMILSYAIMIGGMFLVINLFSKRMSSEGMMGGLGKSKAKVYMEKQTGVTFKDVAGQDEAKESLQEIIDFLHNTPKSAPSCPRARCW